MNRFIHMKYLLIFLLPFPFLSFGQSNQMLDSVNYYFYEILNHERDSINSYHEGDESFTPLVHVNIESDELKFVNPKKHLNKALYQIGNERKYTPHSTTNIENFLCSYSSYDFSENYEDPKEIAYEFFQSWKTSPKGHYDVMINANDWKDYIYDSFIILYKVDYNPKNSRKAWVMVATYTVFKD